MPPSAARAATQAEAIAHGENVTISVNIAQAFECVRVAVGCMAAEQKAVAGAGDGDCDDDGVDNGDQWRWL